MVADPRRVDSLRRRFSCGVELALEVLGGKWKPVILARLKQGRLHYAELRALIPALSDKILTQRLADLEELGLVKRHKRGKRGAPSSYELTARAQSLRPALDALYAWGEQIAEEVGAVSEPPAVARAAAVGTHDAASSATGSPGWSPDADGTGTGRSRSRSNRRRR
jgi:DNA-binding HxlR family transcriptional regulator